MRRNRFTVWLPALLLVALASWPAFGLAPPRIHKSIPPDGGILTGRVVELHGMSLEYAPKGDPVVVDKTTGRQVPAVSKMECEWYGEGDRPGDRQQYCIVRVTLEKICAGHVYWSQLPLPFGQTPSHVA